MTEHAEQHKGERGRFAHYDALRAWSAVGATITLAVGVLGLLLAVWQFRHTLEQERWDTAMKAVLDENWEGRPYTSRVCLGGLPEFQSETLVNLHNRKAANLKENEAEWVRRCFADLDPDEKKLLYDPKDEPRLSAKGTALLAQRVNAVLDKDEFVANLIMLGRGDEPLLLKEYGKRICEIDKPVVEKIRAVGNEFDVLEFKTDFQWILDFDKRHFCSRS
jgi:hypothetical protein